MENWEQVLCKQTIVWLLNVVSVAVSIFLGHILKYKQVEIQTKLLCCG